MFIRIAAAFNTAAHIRLGRLSVIEAADNTLREVAAIGGGGGVIVLDARGNYAMRFNTSGMYRGAIGNDGVARVGIYEEPEVPITL
jgi:beta-aspartyl-peptidase (threonine type)